MQKQHLRISLFGSSTIDFRYTNHRTHLRLGGNMRPSRISLSTYLFFSLLCQSSFAASTAAYRFLYPSTINSSSIEVNYLDSINVSWAGSNTSTSSNLNATVLSINCWKTNTTNIGTCVQFPHLPQETPLTAPRVHSVSRPLHQSHNSFNADDHRI